MNRPAVALACEGCGARPRPLSHAPFPATCPNRHEAADPIDHLLAPHLDPSSAAWPLAGSDAPFVRFRRLLHAHAVALGLGVGDDGYLAIHARLQAATARIDGRTFATTPFAEHPALARAAGVADRVFVKDETVNVAGSHKGRHLFGVLLHLDALVAAEIAPHKEPALAIASCGNAALAAAVLAAASQRELHVFVPEDAQAPVVARLARLGAKLHVCPRKPDEMGDPTLRAFRAAVARGAWPFTCQGPECGLALDGGKTLGLEIAASGVAMDRIFIQIGGGALASSVARAFDDAITLRAPFAMPRIMAVQTEAVAPLAAAYGAIVREVRRRCGSPSDWPVAACDALADRLREPGARAHVDGVLAEVRRHRAAWLPPWPSPGPSAAHGILDDETYDAAFVLGALFRSGGWPIVVTEKAVIQAEIMGRAATAIDVDATGTAGLAGLLAWSAEAPSPRARETIALLFTGQRR